MEFPFVAKESCSGQARSRKSLQGGLERLSYKTVKVNSGLCWRPQEGGDARVMRHLSRKIADRVWHRHKREKYAALNKAERDWRSEMPFDIRHGNIAFGVYPVDF